MKSHQATNPNMSDLHLSLLIMPHIYLNFRAIQLKEMQAQNGSFLKNIGQKLPIIILIIS